MKKRIKTSRLTNIYHSDDDDVGYNLLSPPLSFFLSLGPSPLVVLIFLSTVSGLLSQLATAKSAISLTLLLL